MASLFFQCKNQEVSTEEINQLRIIQKMEAQEPVVIGFIGGSITEGTAATAVRNRYANKVVNKLKLKYEYDNIQLVNAGIGATTSGIANYRVYNDLLNKSPDLVFVDFSVNDPRSDKATETYEGLIRQIRNQAEVVSLIFTNKNFINAEEQHRKITDYYRIPTLSIKDTLENLLHLGLKWEDFYNDVVHPNDNGHELISNMIVDKLSFMKYDHHQNKVPLTENKYQNTKMVYANELSINQHTNYKLVSDSPRFGSAYRALIDNSLIEFDFEGEYLSMLCLRNSGSKSVEVTIDGKSYLINTYIENERGYQAVFDFGKVGTGKHNVTITNQGNFEFNAFMAYSTK
ncbi:MAG: SGNH/GDSL hydrolase family protein [Bacteroidota bacterium]